MTGAAPRDVPTLAVSEIFASIQGEGPSAGEPCVFLRLAGCNLRCRFCDTPYTWDYKRYRVEDEVTALTLDDVLGRLVASGQCRLVITGGEPLLQQRTLAALLSRLPGAFYVEIETNGTVLPDAALVERVNQWNVSPKLSNAGDDERARLDPTVLAAFLATERAYLKLVVGSGADLIEAEALRVGAGWPASRTLLMPEAATRAELARRAGFVREEALRRGVGYSPRLHVERWDGARGR